MPYSRIPRAPVISISSMGLSLNLRKATKLATKTIPAAISKCACVSCDRVLTEVNANNSIVAAAERINPAEAALSPSRTLCAYTDCVCLRKNKYRPILMQMPGMTQPIVAQTAPGIPAIWIPTKVEVLTVKGPGVICEMVIMSAKVCSLSHPSCWTTCDWIIGIIAYPPPIPSSPILKKVYNNSKRFIFLFSFAFAPI